MGFNTSTLWRILTKDRYEANDPPADYKGIVQDIENRAAGAAQLVADLAARNALPSGQLYAGKRVVTLADGLEYIYRGTAWELLPNSRTSVLLQQNNQRATGANIGDIAWDTVIFDPSTMRSGLGVKALWTGRYHVLVRAALQGSIGTGDVVTLDCVDAGTGTAFSQVSQNGLAGDKSMQLIDEFVLNAGTVIRFRLGWTGSSGSRNFSYGDDSTRARIAVRYAGTA